MKEAVLYEQHMHTPLCRHAIGEPEEYAAQAYERNLKGIVVTCHNPLPDGLGASVRMRPEQWDEYLEIVQRARDAWAGRVDVRLGLEVDFWPGLEPFLEKQLASAEFHHVLGSVHPQMDSYRALFWRGDIPQYQHLYFHHLAAAAESGLFDTLSHPDLIKNCDPAQWGLKRLMPDIEYALDRIAKTGVAMELNTSGLNKAISEMNPGPQILKAMNQREIPVVIGADAHSPRRVADRFEIALDLLQEAGYRHTFVTVDRKRTPVLIETARASLQSVENENSGGSSLWEQAVSGLKNTLTRKTSVSN